MNPNFYVIGPDGMHEAYTFDEALRLQDALQRAHKRNTGEAAAYVIETTTEHKMTNRFLTRGLADNGNKRF